MRDQYTFITSEIGILPRNETSLNSVREDSDRKQGPSPGSVARSRITTWVKICVFILVVLIGLKFLGLQIFVRVDFDDKSFLATLTEFETYYLPLGLLLVYLVASRLWKMFLGPKDD